jgi:manganese/zinc/iron transport system permease protein
MAALIGNFTYLRKRSLIGDAISHAVLPGICLAYLIHGEKNLFYLLLGALASGLLSVFLIDFLSKHRFARNDTAIALMLSSFFGLGLVLLTYIQHEGGASQSGLDGFLFGKAASLSELDVLVFSVSFLLIACLVYLFRRGFGLLSFDEDFAQSIGFPVKGLRVLLSVLTVWAVATGIQAVGVVLMAALLIAPSLTARLWSESLKQMIFISLLVGLLAGYSGAMVSYLKPGMPTGPWVVVSAGVLALFSLLIAPGKGLLSQWKLRKSNEIKMLTENLLKLFYQISEKSKNSTPVTEDDLLNRRSLNRSDLNRGLKLLSRNKFIVNEQGAWRLSTKGEIEAKRIVRLHRLWELYLQEYLHLDADHVHDDAEAMEHVITPEIEKQLEDLLGRPERDPHQAVIPRAYDSE